MSESICPNCKEPSELPYCAKCGRAVTRGDQTFPKETLPPLPEGELSGEMVGRYKVVREIAKGGMGIVLLVYDPESHRYVALKNIQDKYHDHLILQQRFMREAYLTAQLSHPGVIPIYSIHHEGPHLYYTMPYVQGRTLRGLLAEARRHQKDPTSMPDPTTTIPAMLRTFMSLAQIVAYAHNRGVLHRDLKLDNVMVGHYGEVYLLDWGLAKRVKDEEMSLPDEEESEHDHSADLTRPGKVFGTLSYMAPELAMGHPPSEMTDIYALGIILYNILALRHPFRRPSIKQFKESWDREKWVDPAKLAPYRNVPPMVARMARKCLTPRLNHRYQSVAALIADLENYIEGRSDWFEMAELKLDKGDDWELHENVYIARETALTGSPEVTEWVTMAISRRSFPGNVKLEGTIELGAEGGGIGLLLSVPEEADRELPNSGYCLWLSSDPAHPSRLFRSSVEVMALPDLVLATERPHQFSLEKVDDVLKFFLDGELKVTYISRLPLAGTHVGLMYRDGDFSLTDFNVSVGSYSVKVNCLAIPDAFLAHKEYAKAISEYRRIGYSFPERDVGREAQFRAGVTLLERAKSLPDPTLKEPAYNLALQEFETLHSTPAAPLEYLGKALVYQALEDSEEEASCFQLAFRKYRHHPFLPVLTEHVSYRMHECSRRNRTAAYRFMLLAAQLLPKLWDDPATRRLTLNLQKHWEPLPFCLPYPTAQNREAVVAQLGFWLGRPYTLSEVITHLAPTPNQTLGNALFYLIELGSHTLAHHLLYDVCAPNEGPIASHLHPLLIAHTENLASGIATLTTADTIQLRVAEALIHLAIRTNQTSAIPLICTEITKKCSPSSADNVRLDALQIWGHLLDKDYTAAENLFDNYPLEFINTENSLLHPLYGCYLAATESTELALIHLGGVLETPYPRSWSLLGHFLTDRTPITEAWMNQAFLWEKRQLYAQLSLYHHCLDDEAQASHFALLEQQQYIAAST